MSKSLVAFDTNRIKGYIFATARLREIVGASGLLKDLNEHTMPQLAKERYAAEEIYAGGGSGLFVVDRDCAGELITAVERAYREQTAGAATVTGIAVDLPSDFDLDHRPASDIWQLAGLKLAARKAQLSGPDNLQLPVRPLVTHPLLRTCDADTAYYAQTFDADDQSYLSMPSMCKRKRYNEQRDAAKESGEAGPKDFDDIATEARPTGYIALIYADGDGFGQALEECAKQSLGAVGKASKEIHQGLVNATQAALAKTGLPRRCYETFISGGDDLLLAVPAQHALAVASQIVTSFDQAIAQANLPTRLSLSASIVWSHVKYPFDAWLDLTEDALKFAKRQKAAWQYTSGGLINFLVVSSANHRDFHAYYRDSLRFGGNGQPLVHRTVRPYTPEALGRLVEQRTHFRSLSRSRLEAVRRAIFAPGVFQAELEGSQALIHWHNREERVMFYNLLAHFIPPGQEALQTCFPYVKTRDSGGQEAFYTPLADLAELWDFLPGGTHADR